MSWHYLQDQEGEYSEAICSDGKPWQPVKSKITHEKHYYGDSLTESFLDSLSGTISTPLMGNNSEEKFILSQADSPARISQQPGKVLESMAYVLDCGRKCTGSLAKYDHDSHLWRTLHYSLLGDLEPFSETWPKSGTMRNGVCWERMTLEHRTEGKESGYWPTPTASDATGGIGHSKKAGGMNLRTKVSKMWPTPDANCGKRGSQPKVKAGPSGLLPTYTINQAVRDEEKRPGKLNPEWIEWLMGWPIQWTDLKPLETGKFQQWRQSHS